MYYIGGRLSSPVFFPVHIDSLDHFLNVVECVSEDEFIHRIKFMSIAMGAVVQFIRINCRCVCVQCAHTKCNTETNLSTLKSVESLCSYDSLHEK